MSDEKTTPLHGAVVEEEIHLTLVELCQACSVREERVTAWVAEGVLEPAGASPQEWRFEGASLRRARLAVRLMRDLEVEGAGLQLALELLEEIAALKARLHRAGLD